MVFIKGSIQDTLRESILCSLSHPSIILIPFGFVSVMFHLIFIEKSVYRRENE